MQKPISITAISSISPLGTSPDAIWDRYQNQDHYFHKKSFQNGTAFLAEISEDIKKEVEALRQSDSKYKALDPTVLYAIYTSRKAIEQAGWNNTDQFGINIGSSRGATVLFEKYHQDFLEQNKAKTLSSPTTTLGNISSWVSHDLQSQGPTISHSITCSTALHAVLNGIAWINSNMSQKFLVGGSEAPLTPFTIGQMKALKIYGNTSRKYPCLALDLSKRQNSMILGEGAAMICLEAGIKENAQAIISGYGYATEILEHNISISEEAQCFQRSMKMALGDREPSDVDIIVMHAPGTIKGDRSELKAIQAIFKTPPALTTNKWKIGHTFGASGALSMELAVLMLQHQKFIDVPYLNAQKIPETIETILVNAVGFGGNAVSILLSKK